VAAELCNLGDVSLGQGYYQQAVGYQRQAFAWFRQAGSQYGPIQALRRLAAALYRAGAHCDLADIHHQADQEEQARYHWQQALDLYTRLGAHEAHQVQPRLSELKAGTAH